MKVREYKKFVLVLAEKFEKNVDSQTSNCFFPLDNSLERCKISLIKKGVAQEGTMVNVFWDRKNPDLPAKVIFLEGTYSL